ncbi:MAG: carbonic anhydrase [Phycisphaeraceae bacterium]|nr:MAG: carbonic anhydrase [Phycisphaeraceae bacterium]
MTELIPVNTEEDILPAYRTGPIGDLIRWHNLNAPLRECAAPELLIGMCMDHRNLLRMPRNFAYILRAGGANFRRVEFKVSFAIAIGGVRTMVLIGHSRCGMVHLRERREAFITGLVEGAGWKPDAAAEHFDENAPLFEIDDAADFVAEEAQRLGARYPQIGIGALYYDVDDSLLSQVLLRS